MPKVLIAEDHPETQLALSIRLRSAGYEVLTADDGDTALRLARQLNPDLIILDVMLPKMDGFHVCRLLKYDDRYAHIPIVMLTGRATPKDRDLGLSVGADVYLVKPIDHRKLLAVIDGLLKARQGA
ncbi:MAG: response regulator [candidate division KSB1 bacterium]|nr:response regulator [candidate division KSB1 bacterium]